VTLGATDPDTGDNGKVKYGWAELSPHFKLDPSSGTSGLHGRSDSMVSPWKVYGL